MIDPEIRRFVAAARAEVQSDQEWSMMNFVPEALTSPNVPEAPSEYVELLHLMNGGIFGSVVIFDAKIISKMQFHADSVESAPVTLGRESWFCFGKVNEDPLFMDRRDGSVWGFPDMGVTWWQSDVFECLSPSLGEFVLEYVFGSGYTTLSGAQDDDQWVRLLARLQDDT